MSRSLVADVLMVLFATLVAAAAEPNWVTTIQVDGASGPPADRCATVATFPPPRPKVERAEVEDPRTRGMLRFDPEPGAANPDLPADIRARAAMPVDVARLPAVPLEGAESAVRHVARVLAGAATHPVRIAMWGDSLTAADRLPGAVRHVLQARYGDAGRGFVLPAPPFPSWNPVDLERCATGPWRAETERTPGALRDGYYGQAGASLEASVAGATAWLQTPVGTKVSSFEVLYLQQPGGGTLRVQVDGAAPIDVTTAAAAVGPGLVRLRVPDGPHRLALAAIGDGPVRLFGVNLDRDVPGISLDGMGVGGSTANDWMAWNEPLMAGFLGRRTPELVLIEYGTNETSATGMTPDKYREQLRAMLGKMRRLAPDSACVLVAPADRGQKVLGTMHAVWSHVEWATRIQAEEAPAFGCATWSMQRAMGGVGSAFGWRLADPPLMNADYLHPTQKGYEELGRRLAAALLAAGG